MFEKKKFILFITKTKIRVSRVVLGKTPKEHVLAEGAWTPDALTNILLKVKKSVGHTVRILLSEDFVYTVIVSLPERSIVTRLAVAKAAQELIPESLAQTVWDFKEVERTPLKIQVVAVVKSLFEVVSSSIIKAGLNIEALEPLSYSLARFTKNQENPIIFVYIDETTLLMLTHKEEVLATERANTITPHILNQFIAFTKEKYAKEPKNIVFCGNTKNIDPKIYERETYKIEIQNISPAVSLAYKQDLKGRDEDVLNLASFLLLTKH